MATIPIFDPEFSSTRDKIINILAANPGINTKAICNHLKKHYAIHITYQAVHKTMRQLLSEKVVESDGKNYKIGKRWVEEMALFLGKLSSTSTNPSLDQKDKVDYKNILSPNTKETITFVLNNRKEFDDFYFKLRTELVNDMQRFPKNERLVFHQIGHLYISLSHPTMEHQFIEELKKSEAKAYFFVNGDEPVDRWATEIYNGSPVKVFLGSGSESTRLVFLYPQLMIEVYYSYKTLEIFRKLYGSKWSIEQVKMSTLLNELYSINDPIKIIISKDPFTLNTVKKIYLDLLRKENIEEPIQFESIEDIITKKDIKGLTSLREYLPKDYCTQAARYILKNKGTIFILTGFYVAGTAETDGLVGAICLSKALEALGFKVIFITDKYASPILGKIIPNRIIDFPIVSMEESLRLAKQYIAELDPSIIISIERCGLSEGEKYHNIRKEDITGHTAKLDAFFMLFDKTISIADTGNEIGMGNLKEKVISNDIDVIPSNTKARYLILATTTNWGSYGLIAALSKLSGKKLTEIDEEGILQQIISNGGIDGITKRRELTYDTFSITQNREIIDTLFMQFSEEKKK